MPLPMVHLAIAVRMAGAGGGFPPPAFLLGSIAPDAIHVRPGAGRTDKRRVHLAVVTSPARVAHERVRALLARHTAGGAERADFAAGYAAHLLADRLWREVVFDPFCASLPPGTSDEDLARLYYQDTDQVDFNLYHRAPWRAAAWAGLAQARAEDFDVLLTAGEIGGWRDRTLDWFGGLKEEPGIEPLHITDEIVWAFVERAAEEGVSFLGRKRVGTGRGESSADQAD